MKKLDLKLGNLNWKILLVKHCNALGIEPPKISEWETATEWNLAVAEAVQAMLESEALPPIDGYHSFARKKLENVMSCYRLLAGSAKIQLDTIEDSMVLVSERSDLMIEMVDDILYDYQMMQEKFYTIHTHCEKVMRAFWKIYDFLNHVTTPSDFARWPAQREVRKLLRDLGFNDRKRVEEKLIERWSPSSFLTLQEESFYLSEYPEVYKKTLWYADRGKRGAKKFNF